MDAFAAGQILVNIFAKERHQRRHDFAQVDQNRIQDVESLLIAGPETVAGAADIPVVENFHKGGNLIAGQRHVIGVQPLFDNPAQAFELGEDIVVNRLARTADLFGLITFGIGIKREEVISVPHRNLSDTGSFGNLFAFLVDGQVAAF